MAEQRVRVTCVVGRVQLVVVTVGEAVGSVTVTCLVGGCGFVCVSHSVKYRFVN